MRALLNIGIPLNDNGHKENMSNQEFRSVLKEMGLQPIDMPRLPTEGSCPEDIQKYESVVHEYCVKRAQPILLRIPQSSPEELDGKEFTIQNTFYAGDLPNSNTIFMLTRHNNSTARFRLLNARIEDLQRGCDELILLIEKYNKRHGKNKVNIAEKIRIYEHGLEYSTIGGTVVKGFRKRSKYVMRESGLEIILMCSGFALFFLSFWLTAADLLGAKEPLRGHVERFSTAMLTTGIVSLISVLNAFRLMPVVQWSANYEDNK